MYIKIPYIKSTKIEVHRKCKRFDTESIVFVCSEKQRACVS